MDTSTALKFNGAFAVLAGLADVIAPKQMADLVFNENAAKSLDNPAGRCLMRMAGGCCAVAGLMFYIAGSTKNGEEPPAHVSKAVLASYGILALPNLYDRLVEDKPQLTDVQAVTSILTVVGIGGLVAKNHFSKE